LYEGQNTVHVVMEMCAGGELYARLIENKQLKEEDACDATHQMLMAVNYLHNVGIVHRDLKLENFLFTEKGGRVLKLIDFGFSTRMSAPVRGSCGSVSYVAPETLRGEAC
jgi:calcium-dependent protein kinase